METTWWIAPFFAGLSTGLYCLGSCFPFITSFLVAERRSFRENVWLLAQFMAGRLAGYLAFGAVFGFLGAALDQTWIRLLADVAMIGLSVLLAVYLIRLQAQKRQACCPASRLGAQSPVAMGFFMGINLCPPFLISLTYVFTLHSTCRGIAYFLIFFLSSSLYFLPLVFAGALARLRGFQAAARLGGFFAAVLFFVVGILSMADNLIRWFQKG
ncbi:MAG: sulfite exporter TauE/SafE family protein [Candidatus Omnitrophota bacterium]|jgi:sulfite exporter TauE/SafE